MKVYKVPLRLALRLEGGFTATMPALRGVVAAVTSCEAAAKLPDELADPLGKPIVPGHDRRRQDDEDDPGRDDVFERRQASLVGMNGRPGST